MTETHRKRDPNPQWNPHAAFAAWAVPGMGHLLLGQRKRGAILLVTIAALWLMGLLLGGIGAVNRKPLDTETRVSWWFYCQSGNVAHIFADQALHRFFLKDGAPTLSAPAFEPSLGKLNEQGVLYTSLAGLLNIMAILDVIYCDPKHRAALDRSRSPKASQEADPEGANQEAAGAKAAAIERVKA